MSTLKQTGHAAAASGILMLIGIEGEWLLDPQRDDGTVTNLPVFVVLLLLATTGFALLLVAIRGLHRHTARSKPARVGAAASTLGAALLVLFGLACLAGTLVTGSPIEAAFLAFLLGMLLLAVGTLTWAVSLRRRPPAPGVARLLMLAGGATGSALVLEADPWHDLALALMCGAWTTLGLLLLRAAGQERSETAGSRSTLARPAAM
jgi:hypothetical protein